MGDPGGEGCSARGTWSGLSSCGERVLARLEMVVV